MLALTGLGDLPADAATITMTRSNSAFSESWYTVSVAGVFTWSDHQAAHAGTSEDPTHYVVGSGFTLRSPTSGSTTFPGDTLTMDGGQFNLNSTNGTTTTVNNFALQNGGIVVNATISSTQALDGTLSVANGHTGFVRTGGTSTGLRNINLDAAVSGAGTLHFMNRGTVAIGDSTNGFSGTWRAGGTGVTIGGASVSNASDVVTTLKAATSGSLGVDASVVIDAYAILDIDYDWETAGSLTLNTNGSMLLDQDITVAALTINGVSLPEDTYTYDDLDDNFAAFFVAGEGSITVGVPEPTGLFTLAAMGAVAVAGRRRRSL